MKTNRNISKVFGSLIAGLTVILFFSGCSKDSNPVDAGTNTANEPVISTYTSPTRGWYHIQNTNNLTSTGKAESPTSGGGGWMTGYANINVGIFAHPVVTTYLENDYSGDPGDYRVETNFRWKGSIAGNGIAGAGAHVEITMEIRDMSNNLIKTYDIHDKEVKNSNLQIGGIIDQGNKNIAVDFTLPNGQSGFKVRFVMKTEAWSGLLGAITQCHFWDREYLGRGCGWSTLKITQLNN
jgi:hypothetical protein